MKHTWRIALALLLGASTVMAQNPVTTPAPEPKPAATPGIVLQDGTPVKLRLTETISSASAHVNDTVPFEVLEQIKVGGLLVIPKGSMAWGTVTEAQHKRRLGRAGKLNISVVAVRLQDGEKAALRAVKDVKGGGHQGAITGAIVATSIVFFPVAPLFLLIHGKDITIPQGTEITAYINGDMPIDPSKFGATNAPANAVASPETVLIQSVPTGADITIDGNYAGSTPSTLKLGPGQHTIIVSKSGFKPWQRTLSTEPGANVTVGATLQEDQKKQ
ncbi:MAG TPA: PEGA domain-containing protein [Patescibacteria group bacterium]|nr:PEGA domain-containing protein [Patescibacteria group bacterium]